jgi:hypothetical protein
VDGRDVSSLPLRKLRPSLSIIPQEPVVFSGSVRDNLDPFREFTDNDLWSVIKQVGGLAAGVSSGSTMPFAVGSQQGGRGVGLAGCKATMHPFQHHQQHKAAACSTAPALSPCAPPPRRRPACLRL